MPSWWLDCPECKTSFLYSEVIDADRRKMDYFYRVSPKPAFQKGLSVECPHCKESSI
jgi:phage FluMu protein Com